MEAIEYDGLDYLLVAAIEDMFAAIHPLDLLDEVLQSNVPQQAELAYEEMILDAIDEDAEIGDWDGGAER